jgi:hypothetical protein
MLKKLSKVGNSLSLVLERPILELMGIGRDREESVRLTLVGPILMLHKESQVMPLPAETLVAIANRAEVEVEPHVIIAECYKDAALSLMAVTTFAVRCFYGADGRATSPEELAVAMSILQTLADDFQKLAYLSVDTVNCLEMSSRYTGGRQQRVYARVLRARREVALACSEKFMHKPIQAEEAEYGGACNRDTAFDTIAAVTHVCGLRANVPGISVQAYYDRIHAIRAEADELGKEVRSNLDTANEIFPSVAGKKPGLLSKKRDLDRVRLDARHLEPKVRAFVGRMNAHLLASWGRHESLDDCHRRTYPANPE